MCVWEEPLILCLATENSSTSSTFSASKMLRGLLCFVDVRLGRSLSAGQLWQTRLVYVLEGRGLNGCLMKGNHSVSHFNIEKDICRFIH